MSAMLECLGCGGVYSTADDQGPSYFHVCPPDELLTVRDGTGQETTAPRPSLTGLVLVDRDADRAAFIAAGGDPRTVRVIVARLERRRSGHRNENTLRREGEGGKIRVIVAEGAGTRPRPDLDPLAGR